MKRFFFGFTLFTIFTDFSSGLRFKRMIVEKTNLLLDNWTLCYRDYKFYCIEYMLSFTQVSKNSFFQLSCYHLETNEKLFFL